MTSVGEHPLPSNVFYERFRLEGSSSFGIRAYRSAAVSDGTVVEVDKEAPLASVGTLLGILDFDRARRPKISLTDDALPGALPLWFVEVASEHEGRPQLSLVAYGTKDFAAGTIISNATFYSAPVRSSEQLGAVRWFTKSGLVDQLFVAETHRHQLVAMSLIFAADAMHHHRGWPGFIHIGGNRTDLGQRAVQHAPNQQRIAPWSQRSRLQP